MVRFLEIFGLIFLFELFLNASAMQTEKYSDEFPDREALSFGRACNAWREEGRNHDPYARGRYVVDDEGNGMA